MSISIQDLLRNLTESGLLTDEEVSTFHESLGPRSPESAEELAKELVRQNHLTKLQAAAVLKGKTRNLVFGDYIVLEKIGAGGMGQVFKARHKPTRKLVAMKVLSAEAVSNRRLIERFKKEAKAIGRLKHPNVVRAYEAGKINKIRYLVMEFVDGENMLARVKRKGPLSIDEVVNCILQASRGLDYAHQKGIIHRDIKPSNLLRDRTNGRVKVVDLGLARVQEPDEDSEDQIRLTMAGQMLGTARFMAPEQVEDARKADVRSDIYSLGCTMYYLLRGKAPFSGETVAHTLMAHVSAPIPDLCRKRPDAPEWLGKVFNRMMAKKPKDRYQSMADLVADIQHHLAESIDEAHVLDEEQEVDDDYSEIVARKDLGASIADLYVDPEDVASAEAAEADIPGNEESSSASEAEAPTEESGSNAARPDEALNEIPLELPGDEPVTHPGFARVSRGDDGTELDTADLDANLEEADEEFPEPVAAENAEKHETAPQSADDADVLADAQSFNIADDLKVAKESGVTDYVAQKLKGQRHADDLAMRRVQIIAGVLGLVALISLAVWIKMR
jgi:serine/threonine protein kinase